LPAIVPTISALDNSDFRGYGFGRQDITEDQTTAEAERIQRRQ
jgi:hypothetical protein